jgi:hypothetical protein
MTNYNLKALIPRSFVQEKREKRRKVLEAVWNRRKINYKRFKERISGILPEQPETAK